MKMREVLEHLTATSDFEVFHVADDHMNFAGRGLHSNVSGGILDLGIDESRAARGLAYAINCNGKTAMGRVYVPDYYTPGMIAYYTNTIIDAALQCHIEKLRIMLSSAVFKDTYARKLMRLCDLSYIKGYVSWYDNASDIRQIVWAESAKFYESDKPVRHCITPLDTVRNTLIISRTVGGEVVSSKRIPYPFSLEDISAYIYTVSMYFNSQEEK